MHEATQLLAQYHERFARTLNECHALQTALQQQPLLLQELDRLWLASDHAATLCCNQPLLLPDLLTQQDVVTPRTGWPRPLPYFVHPFFAVQAFEPMGLLIAEVVQQRVVGGDHPLIQDGLEQLVVGGHRVGVTIVALTCGRGRVSRDNAGPEFTPVRDRE